VVDEQPVRIIAGEAGEDSVWTVLRGVPDPEIPVVSVVDLGIVRYVRMPGPQVGITPTYSGCPATEVIRESIRSALAQSGYPNARIEEVLSPPWSAAWISAEGRRKLSEYGIAPPNPFSPDEPESCPHCGGRKIEMISQFGSTPCKALFRCLSCREPFDYFKCH
jgi:ring-1,2-phenylacetyl-CoA epoxidase subunit PaaD